MTTTEHLNRPHGGTLVSLLVETKRREELREGSKGWPSWDLTPRQLCDLELLMNGGFSPLQGFMGQADYESVCSSMRLKNGLLWTMPVVLDLPAEFAKKLKSGTSIALRDPEGVMLAVLHVEETWEPNRQSEAENVFGTADRKHPGVSSVLDKSNPIYVSGKLEGLQLPSHYDYRGLRLTPAEMRAKFAQLGWRRVVAFQTRNPMHRAHVELTFRAAKETSANLLIHPSVGMTKPGDVDHYTRVRCYQAILPHYPANTAQLALLPLAMRMGGPREAVWHAIIRKNFGCTHFIVGRDHAGPGNDSNNKPFYDPYGAQNLLEKYQDEVGVKMVPFKMMVYLEDKDTYVPEDEVPKGSRVLNISGTELRNRLAEGRDIPTWFTYPQVVTELRRTYPPRHRQGFTVFFTGLSGSGKSTIANVLLVKLLEMGGRPVTLLDGDIVRKNLSSELGFSKEHRDLNIRRIGFVAREITQNGGIAVCAPIAPYDSIRKELRQSIDGAGGFILVHTSTSLEVCEQRDRKGLYAKARAGIIPSFTGVSDPYESPADAEVVIDTTNTTPEEAAQEILLYLEKQGYVGDVAETN
ncbi:MAG: bifunctional sulfate adenylyltransferase/adenylylsulfate kinase [Candidatus Acidiferrales bacterium]